MLIELAAVDGTVESGGKGAALVELVRAGLPVPPTWVLPAGALRDHLARSDLVALAAQVEVGVANGAWRPTARQLQSAILRAPLPGDVARPVAGLLAGLRASGEHATLAIRSSATCEGLPGASFAGQFQTFLGVEDFEQASTAIRSCWASLWSPAALSYRAALGSASGPGMAVLLQVFVPGEGAGAARVHDDGVEIESAWGLGPSVLSGLVVPDRYWLGLDGQLLRAEPGRKPVRATAQGGNLVWEPVRTPLQEAPSLDQAAAGRVARLALKAANCLGMPLEMEWVLDGDAVWVLQGRRARRLPWPGIGPINQPGDGELHGIPAAPGEVVGRVRLVERLEDLDEADPGGIVVMRYASAAMLARFRCAGLVTEMGGSSAHAAATARERRLPMVTGVLGITQRLHEGQVVGLDGARGVVEVLEP